MIFGNFGPEFLDEKHPEATRRMQRSYYEAISPQQAFWEQCDYNMRMYSGDQSWQDAYTSMPMARRTQIAFNRIRRTVNLTSGFQRRNRKSLNVIPLENADNLTADQYTKIFMWLDQKENMNERISEAFHLTLISGMTLLQPWIDYRDDPINGDIKFDVNAYSTFLCDPFFRKQDMSDCNYVWKRQYLTKQQIISLLPDHEDEILALPSSKNGPDNDARFQYMPENFAFSISNLMTYDEYWYKSYRKTTMLLDGETGESMEWMHNDDEALRLFLRTYPKIIAHEQTIPTYNLTVSTQGKVMFDGWNPLQLDELPFVGFFAYFQPDNPYFSFRIQGMVNDLRDAQWLYNRRQSIMLDILESQPNSGFILKEDALVNPNDVYLAGQGKAIVLKKGAQMTDIQQIISPQIPPTTIDIGKNLAEELIQVSGVTEELFGHASDDIGALHTMLRQGAGLTTLQILYDQCDHSVKRLGNMMLKMIQRNWTPGKVKKILEGQEPSPQFYQKAFGRYGCNVVEGANTESQRQLQLLQMLQLREAGVPISPTSILKASTIANKERIIEEMEQEQQQQQQQQQAQLQMAQAEMEARIEALKAKSASDQGSANERNSRVAENQELAEANKAKAHREDEQATLNMVKALKELDDLDLGQIEKLLQLKQLAMQMQAMEATEDQLHPQQYQQSPPPLPTTPGIFGNDGSMNPMMQQPTQGQQ